MPELSERIPEPDHLPIDKREPALDSPNVEGISETTKTQLKRTVYMRPPEIIGDCLHEKNYQGMALYLSILYKKIDISIDVDDLARELEVQLKKGQIEGKPVASAQVFLKNGDAFSVHAVQSREFGYSKATFSSTNPAIDEALKTQ